MGIHPPPPDIKIFTEHMNAQKYVTGIENYLMQNEAVDIALIIFTDYKQTRLSPAYDGLKKLAS